MNGLAGASAPYVGTVRIDPRLYGRVTPHALTHWQRYGFRVTRIGGAALLRGPSGQRWIVGCWDGPAPTWAPRLRERHLWLLGRGPMPAAERRRETRWLHQRKRARLRSPINGRFLPGPVPWWWPTDARGWPVTVCPRELQPWALA